MLSHRPEAASADLMFGLKFKGSERVYHWYTEEEATMGGWMEALAKSLKLGADAQIPEGRYCKCMQGYLYKPARPHA